MLHYLTDEYPGIRRVRRGGGFIYLDSRGRKIADRKTLERIRSIVIPPAWKDVWICPIGQGHLQATGRDARGRKQYRYHAEYRAHRDESKYQQLEAFGKALPSIRRRIARDLAKPGLPREKVLAVIVRLLERTLIRVGNEEYARENRSYGLTTLLDHHVKFYSGSLELRFRGKSGIQNAVVLKDPQLARLVKKCHDIPGQILFQYYDDEGVRRRAGSADVNEYLREMTAPEFSGEFTAKCFRTWGGTLAVMERLAARRPPQSARESKREIAAAVREAAHALGNTSTVCRKYYVHPAVLAAYESGALAEARSRESSRERLLKNILRQSRSRAPSFHLPAERKAA